MKYDAIVIGAGPNGLTAAAVLARKGRRVLVLEAASGIGGHTRAIEFAPGCRAPLIADNGWMSPRVARALGVRVFDRSESMKMFVASAGKDGPRYVEFVARMHKFADLLGALYQLPPPDIDTTSPTEILPLISVALKTKALGRADMVEFLRVMPMSVQDLVDDTFDDDELKAMIASAAIRDLQQGPRSAGTTFNLLHYMIGAPRTLLRREIYGPDGHDWFAKLAANVARKAGAEIRVGTRVGRITAKDGNVTGVALENGDEIAAPIVLSTADPKRTLLGLVDPVWLDPGFMLAVRNIKLRGCSAYVMFGVDKPIVGPLTRTATISTATLEKAADAAKYGEVSAEPHVEFFSPSARWPQLSNGAHTVVARVQYVPYRSAVNEKQLIASATKAIARVVAGFESSVVASAAFTPKKIEAEFGVTEGALTQGEMMLDQILFMRPVPGWSHYEMPVRGLFLAGAGAHPGPGILGGAGYLAASAALKG